MTDLVPLVCTDHRGLTWTTGDGTPYRPDERRLVHAQPDHVAELRAQGFRPIPDLWAMTPSVPEAEEPELAKPARKRRGD